MASLLLITLIAIFIRAKSSFREIFKYIILIIIIPIILSITVDILKKNILFSDIKP